MENADAPFASSPNNCYFDDKTSQEDLKCKVRFNVNPNATFRSVTEARTGEIATTKYFENLIIDELFVTMSSSEIILVKSVVFTSKLFRKKEEAKLDQFEVENLPSHAYMPY